MPGSLSLLETSLAAGGTHRHGVVAEGCEGLSAGSRRPPGRPTRFTHPASSRCGTVHPSGPPGSAARARVALARQTPSPGTPRLPSAIRPRTRRSPRPGRSSTKTSRRTDGRRSAPTGTGARTRATPARFAAAPLTTWRPVLVRRPPSAAGPEGAAAVLVQRRPHRPAAQCRAPPSRLGPHRPGARRPGARRPGARRLGAERPGRPRRSRPYRGPAINEPARPSPGRSHAAPVKMKLTRAPTPNPAGGRRRPPAAQASGAGGTTS